MNAPGFSLSRKTFSFKYVFVEDLNSRKRAIHECHENLATKKSNDSTMSGKEIPETFDVWLAAKNISDNEALTILFKILASELNLGNSMS